MLQDKRHSIYSNLYLFPILLLGIVLHSCDSIQEPEHTSTGLKVYFNDFDIPQEYKSGWEAFDPLFYKDSNYLNDFDLTLAVQDPNIKKKGSFDFGSKMINNAELSVDFFPLDQDTSKSYQYIHQYRCVYDPPKYKFATVAYPNPCMGKDTKAKARFLIHNKSDQSKSYRCRMFYQNTSYWYATDSASVQAYQSPFKDNYYGSSNLAKIELGPGEQKEVWLEYVIGNDPKGNDWFLNRFYGPARAGHYEFMLWVSSDPDDPLTRDSIALNTFNPFVSVQQQLLKDSNTLQSFAYLPPDHFKFIFLQENFDLDNILKPGDIYKISHQDQKALCDTCTGWFKDVISDNWKAKDFFEGFIDKAPYIKAEFGNRKENIRIDENGIYFKNPGSNKDMKQKTWGEIKFCPGFLYGTVKIVAKYAQLRNKSCTPTGIIHNLWLYQFNHPTADPIEGHPYAYLTNENKKQPYEIDIEIWSKIYDENWSGGSQINFSVVDYMRNQYAQVKPGQQKTIQGQKVDRLNDVQLNVPSKHKFERSFFEQYHLYEIEWAPQQVIFRIDGKEMARIDGSVAEIPDKYAFLWLGSPMYQDGTYYVQKSIPFLTEDHFSHIRYISIE